MDKTKNLTSGGVKGLIADTVSEKQIGYQVHLKEQIKTTG